MKKLLGIHIEAMKKPRSNKLLKSQQPSWKIAAGVFLASIKTKTRKWKQAKTKDIRIIAEVPIQAEESPELPGHFRASGKISTSGLIAKRQINATKAQHS